MKDLNLAKPTKVCNIFLLYGPKVLVTCHLFHPDLWICSSTGTLTSDLPTVTVDSRVISCLGLVGSHLHGMQEKCPEPHQSFCQPREVIDWVHITLWTLQRASSAKPYRSATLYIIVPDAPWSGTVCCPTSSIRVHRWGSMGSIPVVMTGEMLKDHPMWYSNIVIKRVRGIYGIWCLLFQQGEKVKNTVIMELSS